MIIEFAGCSGSGKSTILRALLEILPSNNVCAHTPFERILGNKIARKITLERIQNLILDVIVLPWSIIGCLRHVSFFRFSYQKTWEHPVNLFHKFLILRSVIRKIGLYVFFSRDRYKNEYILFDESTIQSAHHYLIYNCYRPELSEIENFCNVVPKPDKLIHVKAPLKILTMRTVSRDDRSRRLSGMSNAEMQKTLLNTILMFDKIIDRVRYNTPVYTIVNKKGPIEDKSILTEKMRRFVFGGISTRRR